MNGFVREHFDIFQQTQVMRGQLLDALTDADLQYQLPGHNPTLGGLFHESGAVQQAYIQSFRTHTFEKAKSGEITTQPNSVAELRIWLTGLDEEMNSMLTGFSDDELQQMIDRKFFVLPAIIHALVYKEAMLIFYAKAAVYFRAMEKPLPPQVELWIG